MKLFWKQKGFMALLSVLITSGVALVIISVLSVNLITQTWIITDRINALNAYYLGNGCAEEGLMRIKRDLTFTNETLVIDSQNQCTVTITSLGSDSYRLNAEGESNQSKKFIEVLFDIWTEIDLQDEDDTLYTRHNIDITSWENT